MEVAIGQMKNENLEENEEPSSEIATIFTCIQPKTSSVMLVNELTSIGGIENKKKKKYKNVLYGVNDTPRFALCLLLGFQHYITMCGGSIAYPHVLAYKLCLRDDDPSRAYLMSTIFLVTGIATLLQTTLGIRLPLVQGSAFSFLLPIIALMDSPDYKCSNIAQLKNANLTNEQYESIWMSRMNEIQGGIIVAGITEALIGITGLVGYLLKWITPLVIIPTITQVGLSLFNVCTEEAGQNWIFSGLVIFTILVLSQYMHNIHLPWPTIKVTSRGRRYNKFYAFKQFPVLIAILIVWFICFLLTVTNVLKSDDPGRTDNPRSLVLKNSPWFRLPYPFQWGLPRFTFAAVVGMVCGAFMSIFESVGDYFACARLCEAPKPPTQSINRGIFIEGVGCVISGVFGTGGAVTSYSENIGAIGLTKVGSRRVMQVASIIMILLGIFAKGCALFSTIPVPIMGGMLIVMASMIMAVGLATMKFIDLNSSRNQFILGISIFLGLCVPKYLADNPMAINSGLYFIDHFLTVLLSNGMFISGFLGFVLDNSVPGSDEERGLTEWLVLDEKKLNLDSTQEVTTSNDSNNEDCDIESIDNVYKLPSFNFISGFFAKFKFK